MADTGYAAYITANAGIVGLTRTLAREFGPQRIRRQRLKRARARGDLPGQAFAEDADVAELARMARAATTLPMTTARDVRLLVDGAAKFDALVEDVRQARTHVHLEYYIWHPGRSSDALLDALVERARAGVAVRLLLDALGAAKAHRLFALERRGPVLRRGEQRPARAEVGAAQPEQPEADHT